MQTAGGAALTNPDNRGSRRRAVLCALAVIAADQITKSLVVANLAVGESTSVIGDVLRISHVRNEGAAFGMLQGLGGLLALAALAGIMVFVTVVVRRPPPLTTYGAALVAAGATGNLLDRLFRGSVVDFVDLSFWWSFNVADSSIAIGAILLLWAGFTEDKPAGDTSAERGIGEPANGA